jgi:endonuclease YncB( thermonuclease family)
VILLVTIYSISPIHAASYVKSIYDGDTLTLSNGDKIRLLQIDTPELSSGECYGQEAKKALIKLVGKSQVTLEGDTASADRDRYGRYLRYIFVGKKNLNLELVKIGAAAPYFYQGEKGKYSNKILKAAKRAKSKKLGLWKKCPGTQLLPSKAITTVAALSNSRKNGISNSVGCDSNYAGCVPIFPPDLDCSDIKSLGLAPVQVIGKDVHKLDRDKDGIGCDS